MRTIYLAGPEVFLPEAELIGQQKKAMCRHYGFEGLFPLDTELAAEALQGDPRQLGLAISAGNEQLIRHCDMLIANLTPFRGPSADVGTVYELGFARALGKPVHGYSHCDQPYQQRLWAQFGADGEPAPAGDVRDRDGLKIEEFDLHDNLMIEGGIHQQQGIFQCIPIPCTDGQPTRRYADLSGFEAILKQLASA